MGIETFYLRNDTLTLEPNGKGALMYVHEHEAKIAELQNSLKNANTAFDECERKFYLSSEERDRLIAAITAKDQEIKDLRGLLGEYRRNNKGDDYIFHDECFKDDERKVDTRCDLCKRADAALRKD